MTAPFTCEERVISTFNLNRYKLSAAGITNIKNNYDTWFATPSPKTQAAYSAFYESLTKSLDENIIAGPDELVAMALIEATDLCLGSVSFDTTSDGYAWLNSCVVPTTGVPTTSGGMTPVLSSTRNVFEVSDGASTSALTGHLIKCASAFYHFHTSATSSFFYQTKTTSSAWSSSGADDCANTAFDPTTTTTYKEVPSVGDMVAICQGIIGNEHPDVG